MVQLVQVPVPESQVPVLESQVYQYHYQYLKSVLKYSSSTSTSTQYCNPGTEPRAYNALPILCETTVSNTGL